MLNKSILCTALTCFSLLSHANTGDINSEISEINSDSVRIYYFFNSGVHPFEYTTYHSWGSNAQYCRIQGGSYNKSVADSGKQRFNVAFGRQMWVLTCFGSMGDQARSVSWTNNTGRFVADGTLESSILKKDDLVNNYNIDLSELNLDHEYFDVEVGDFDSNSFDDIAIVDKYSKKLYIYISDENGTLELSHKQDSVSSFDKIESLELYNGKLIKVNIK